MNLSSNHWYSITRAFLADSQRGFALVSLISKKGSSYLQPGARLLVNDAGSYWGEISAGCLEEKVSSEAVTCIRSGQNRLLTIDTRPLYGCFGEITLLIEVLTNKEHFAAISEQVFMARKSREAIQLQTDYSNLQAAHLTTLFDGDNNEDSKLVQKVEPPVQCFIFGDWPDGRSVATIAEGLGWDCHIYDASAPGFDCAHQFEKRCIDSRTAVLIATHNLTRDASCLQASLRTGCRYIGVVGSSKRRQELENILCAKEDFQLIENLEKVCCPAGLDIGGQGAQGIALSIVAEIQAVFSGRNAAQLRNRKQPIHSEGIPL